MHFTREEKHGHSANSVTVHSPFFFFLLLSETGHGKGFDKRQWDVRCIRGGHSGYLSLGLCLVVRHGSFLHRGYPLDVCVVQPP